jgi:ABC-type multidrug transport system fused ATPase/permease subunit
MKNIIMALGNTKAFSRLIKHSAKYRFSILVIAVINVLASLFGIATALASKNMIDTALSGHTDAALKFGIILAVLFLCSLIISSFAAIYAANVRESMRNKLQLDFLENMYEKDWLPLSGYKSGDLLTRINGDVLRIVDIWITVIPSILALFVQLITAYLVLSRYDSLLALLAFIIGPITFVPSILIGRKLKKIQHFIQQSESTISSFINESIQNLVIIKAFKLKNENIKQIGRHQEERRAFVFQKNLVSAHANFILGLGYQIGFFSALAFGAFRLSTGAITFGTFAAFLQLVSQIQAPIDNLARLIPQIITALASVERLEEVRELPEESRKINEEINNGQKYPEEVFMDNIYFEYKKNSPILNKLTLRISRGEKIALVGSSGEGKTTLARVLLGLITPQSGRISLTFRDGSVIPVTPASREYFAYVPQNNALFSGSIEYNLKMADKYASSEDIQTALSASSALQFIAELPLGLDTIVGEKGIGLSEGQIQRICIARALLRKAPFLILDEATSALDAESENSIIHGLLTSYPNTTIIAVTHRDSILKHCDSVYALKSGKLIKY